MKDNALIVTVKRLKGEDDYRTFSVRIRKDTLSALEKVSIESGRSRNELIGIFLDYALANCKIEKEDSHEPILY